MEMDVEYRGRGEGARNGLRGGYDRGVVHISVSYRGRGILEFPLPSLSPPPRKLCKGVLSSLLLCVPYCSAPGRKSSCGDRVW